MAFKIGSDSRAATGGDRGRIEDGTYPTRFVQIIDMGVQNDEDYKTGEVKGTSRHLWITFEFPTERIELEKEGEKVDLPRWQSKEVKLSFDDRANLTKFIKALDPKGTSKTLEGLLGKPCMVEVGSTSGNKAKLVHAFSLPKGMTVDELENDPQAFDMDSADLDVYDKLPDFLKEKIQEAHNFEGSDIQKKLLERGDEVKSDEPDVAADDIDFDDDLPFDPE